MPGDKVEILGVGIDLIDQDHLLQKAIQWATQPGKAMIAYVNAHCLNLAVADEDYRNLLNQFDLVYSDGIGVVWAGWFLRRERLYKVTGRAWIREFCELCQAAGVSIYLLGGMPGVAQEAQKRLLAQAPNLNILGASDGYFHEKSEAEVLLELSAKKPDVVLVGMGVPRQEKWIAANKDHIPSKICWAVGALIDYCAGKEPPVPGWMEGMALEWLWRMLMNPKEKWRRYIIGNPLFTLRILKEKLR